MSGRVCTAKRCSEGIDNGRTGAAVSLDLCAYTPAVFDTASTCGSIHNVAGGVMQRWGT